MMMGIGRINLCCCVHLDVCLFIQARALVPQHAETDVIRFIVGTQSLKFENQVSSILMCHTLYCPSFTPAKHVYLNKVLKNGDQCWENENLNFWKFQVHLIDFDDESNVINKNVFMHSAGEIW